MQQVLVTRYYVCDNCKRESERVEGEYHRPWNDRSALQGWLSACIRKTQKQLSKEMKECYAFVIGEEFLHFCGDECFEGFCKSGKIKPARIVYTHNLDGTD